MDASIIILIVIVSSFNFTGIRAQKKDLGTVIGIDLGTTYSCVGIFKSCHVEIIENDQGNRITPSYVAFKHNGERLIGDDAKNLLATNPNNTIFDVKRLMGRKFKEPSVQEDIKHYPFSVVERNNRPVVQIKTKHGTKMYTPEEISAMILSKMRSIAETYLGHPVQNAVITVPAYFNNAQRQATKDAGTIAGLNVLRIINEPTAAAIAYGLDKLTAKERMKNVLVFDLGGGTFDVSLLTLDNGVFEVLATNGNTHLGGEDFDQRVIDYFIKLFESKTRKNVRKNTGSIEKLRREVEKAKRILSLEDKTRIEIESFMDNIDFSETLTRAKFEELNKDLFQSTLVPVGRVLEDARLKKTDIDEVILVGGSTRIPKIPQLLKEYFNGKEPSRGVNPDEAVAHGAAIQGAILSGERCISDIAVLDITPLTLGIETVGGVMAKLISRNTNIPVTEKKTFSTNADNQDVVAVQVFEGERPMTKDNHFLGKFDLTGILPAARGLPEIIVTFDIDVNGILTVTAEEKSAGIKKNIVIDSKTNRLATQEIDRMIIEAERFSEQDKAIKDRINARNDFESFVYSVRNHLADPTKPLGMLPTREQIKVEYHVEKEIQWLDENSDAKTDDILEHNNQFEQTVTKILHEFERQSSTANNTHWNEGDL